MLDAASFVQSARRGFTLLEVLVALVVFAMAAVVLGSSYLNVLNTYEVAARGMTVNEDFAFARDLVLREPNRKRLGARTHAIYLRSSPEELFRRLRHDTHRPLLQVGDPLNRLRELYRDRDPLYRSTARFVIETGRPSVRMLVNMVLMQLELAGVIDPALVPSSIEPPSG